ncbi:MAG: hypothetical protein ACYTFW_02575 [Planctomycetota bacterium]|jgi:hypothetical protein
MRPRFLIELNNYEAIHRFIQFHEELVEILNIPSIGELYSSKKKWESGVLQYLHERKKKELQDEANRKAQEQARLEKARSVAVANEVARVETVQTTEDILNDEAMMN